MHKAGSVHWLTGPCLCLTMTCQYMHVKTFDSVVSSHMYHTVERNYKQLNHWDVIILNPMFTGSGAPGAVNVRNLWQHVALGSECPSVTLVACVVTLVARVPDPYKTQLTGMYLPNVSSSFWCRLHVCLKCTALNMELHACLSTLVKLSLYVEWQYRSHT